MGNTTPAPQADATLAALAVLARLTDRDFDGANALMDSSNDQELLTGLLDVARYVTSIAAKAAGVTPQDVLTQVRTTVLDLVNKGELDAGPFRGHGH